MIWKVIWETLVVFYHILMDFIGYVFVTAMYLNIIILLYALFKGIFPLAIASFSFGLFGAFLIRLQDVFYQKEENESGGDHADRERHQT